MACTLTFHQIAYVVAGAVALAVFSPSDWGALALDGLRKRFGVGPGGPAVEDEEGES